MRDPGFDAGLLLGVLIGEGHFGGDRKQPHVTLKMHVRHLPLLEWLRDRVPGARLYGPYVYERRHFYQLMIRGGALRERIIPLLDTLPWKEIDTHTFERYQMMKRRYGIESPDDLEAPVGFDSDSESGLASTSETASASAHESASASGSEPDLEPESGVGSEPRDGERNDHGGAADIVAIRDR